MNAPIEAKKALEVKDRVWRVVVAAGAAMRMPVNGRQHAFPMKLDALKPLRPALRTPFDDEDHFHPSPFAFRPRSRCLPERDLKTERRTGVQTRR